ncbi:hypothetical protein BH23PLA1_BH23PLA1_31850 [soil metagenome]
MTMTPTQQAILWGYALIVLAWPIRHLVVTFIIHRLDVLNRHSPRFDGAEAPLVSAIIPAKDEETTLADCLASVCAQTYPNLEILVVDDRSTDRTDEIAQSFAERDPRVRVLSIEDLPPGWTGKAHALQMAAEQAHGDWFWFIDADTRHTPESLAIVFEYARSRGAVLASLLPEMRCETFWEKVVQPLAGIVLMRSFPTFRVNNDASSLAFANGQYILIERSAYEAAGGHRAVQDRFVEDIYLAKRVKALGLPIRVAFAPEVSSTRMYTSLDQLVRGWSRILYDALGRRPWPLAGKILEPLIFSQTGDISLIVAIVLLVIGPASPFALWLLGLSLVHQVLKQSVLYRMYRISGPSTAIYALWYPLAGIVSAWILLKSLGMCRTGRVTWRGTSYGPSPSRTDPSEAAPEVVKQPGA